MKSQDCRCFGRMCQDQDLGTHSANVAIREVFLKKWGMSFSSLLLPTSTEGGPPRFRIKCLITTAFLKVIRTQGAPGQLSRLSV